MILGVGLSCVPFLLLKEVVISDLPLPHPRPQERQRQPPPQAQERQRQGHQDHPLFSDNVRIPSPFARNPTDFRLLVAFQRKTSDELRREQRAEGGDGGEATAATTSSKNPFFYSDRDIHMILRAMYAMQGMIKMGLWSGTTAQNHLIGTGSCMAMLRQPPHQVAAAILHVTYLQDWIRVERLKRMSRRKHECSARAYVALLVGKTIERAVWTTTSIHGTGPWTTCVESQLRLRRILLQQTNREDRDQVDAVANGSPEPQRLSSRTLQKLDQFLDDTVTKFTICDEIEEYLGGDVALAGNWKRRPTSHWDNLYDLAMMVKEPKLAGWVRQAQQKAEILHPPNPETDAFEELTVPNKTVLFNSETFNADADPNEVQRLQLLTSLSRLEQTLQPQWLGSECSKRTCRTIARHRTLCDKFAANETTIEDYLDEIEALKSELRVCEDSKIYASMNEIMPQTVPSLARQYSETGIANKCFVDTKNIES